MALALIIAIGAQRHTVAPAFVLVPIAVAVGAWLLWLIYPRDLETGPYFDWIGALLRQVDRIVERFESAPEKPRRDDDANARGPLGQP
jgi:hypothetical protein